MLYVNYCTADLRLWFCLFRNHVKKAHVHGIINDIQVCVADQCIKKVKS